MSRAFMKEADAAEPRCPGCGGPGEDVGRPTLEAQLDVDTLKGVSGPAWFCPDPACPAAYFGNWGAAVPAAKLAVRAYPKDPDGPLCACFGMSAAEVVGDALAGRKERVRALLERARGPEARCVARRPDGRCCAPIVSRLFRESFKAP